MVTKLKYKFGISIKLILFASKKIKKTQLTLTQRKWQNSLPQGIDLKQVLFFDNNLGWKIDMQGAYTSMYLLHKYLVVKVIVR